MVHERDGYPRHLPGSDYRSFLFGHEALGAWVVESDDRVIGQVALHPHSSKPVMDVATTALGLTADRLGVVARLVVHPDRRGRGAGAELLARAADEAVALGRWPILDVVQDLTAAVLLYERQGWVRLGHVTVTFRNAVTVEEFVYAARLRP